MNNKQLFEQSASKILSKNQLEGVMKLHNALFECGQEEMVADTVADAVVDAVRDSVDEVAEEQVDNVVDDAVESAPSIEIVPADRARLESLIDSMSDKEKQMFFESLDDQQVQVLMEGRVGALTKFLNFFTKAGRKANRLDKFEKLASKDADLTNKWLNLSKIGDGNLNSKNASDLRKLGMKRDAVRQQMNDMRYKAGKGDVSELKEMDKIAKQNKSFNFNADELEGFKSKEISSAASSRTRALKKAETDLNNNSEIQSLQQTRDAKIESIKNNTSLTPQERDAQINAAANEYEKAKVQTQAWKDYEAAKTNAQTAYNGKVEKINAKYKSHLEDAYEREGGFNGFNGTSNVGRGSRYRGTGRYNQGQFGSPYGYPPYMNPEAWGQFTGKFSTMRKVARGLVGSYKAFMAALKLGALGVLGIGAYKVYSIFSNPEEIDAANSGSFGGIFGGSKGGSNSGSNGGEEEGSVTETVMKVIAVLGGGVGGNVIARFLGFNGTTGKTVGTLLGAALVAYFMFLNGGDEKNAVEMLDEYNNATPKDKQIINEALDIPGLGEALQSLYDENH